MIRAPINRETAKCCRGAGDHEEWCDQRLGRGETARRRGKRLKRSRAAARRREKALIDARARILVDESERVAAGPSRINNALSSVVSKINDELQSEDAWWALWREP